MLSELLSGSVPLQAYLLLAAVLFCTGVWGLINSRNAVRVLMSIELMLNAVNINLMAFSSYVDGQLIRGQVILSKYCNTGTFHRMPDLVFFGRYHLEI